MTPLAMSKEKMVWLIAMPLPLAMVPLAGVLVTESKPFSRFLSALPAWSSITVMNAMYFAPSYGVFLLSGLHHSKRRRAIGIFTLLLIPYMPILLLFGLVVSCLLFNSCL